MSGLILKVFELCEKKQYGIFHIVGNDFINRFQWALGASKILELDSSLVQELKDSLKILGKEIASIPQLASTVDLGGIALTYVLRKIVEDTNSISSGRYCINLKDIFKDK